MDTSNKYVRMCEAASEIQKMQIPSCSYVCPPVSVGEIAYMMRTVESHQQGWIWLPSQDQLQNILEFTDESAVDMWTLKDFWKFCSSNHERYITMEQLWLAFVMKEKFDKTWDGDEWKEEKLK